MSGVDQNTKVSRHELSDVDVIEPSDSSDDEFVDAQENESKDELSDVCRRLPPDQDFSEELRDQAEEDPKEDDALKARREEEENLSESELQDRKIEAETLKKKGNELYVNSENDEAISIYSKALDICPLKDQKDRAILYSNRAAAKLKKVQPHISSSLFFNAVFFRATKNLLFKIAMKR